MIQENNSEVSHIIDLSKQYFLKNKQSQILRSGIDYLPVTAKTLCENDLAHLVESSLDLWLTAGRFTQDFEKKFSHSVRAQSPKGAFVNSGSSANLLTLSALTSENSWLKYGPLKPNDEVITTAAGFPTTINPIFQNQLKPVFVDSDMNTLNPSFTTIREAVTPQTRAIILAHTLGNPFDADQLAEFCSKNNIYLIEDCCDALGAKIKNQNVGTFGDLSTFSFYPAHHITTGEGGFVFSKNSQLMKIVKSFRDWGRDCWCETGQDNTCQKRFEQNWGELPFGFDHKYIYTHVGYNLKATDMQAALGLSQLQKVEQFIEARITNWNYLYHNLSEDALVRKHLKFQNFKPDHQPSWFGFSILCESLKMRNFLVQFLEKNKIGTRLLFSGNYTKQPLIKNKVFKTHSDLSHSDIIMNQQFWIGVHPRLNQDNLDYMISQFKSGLKIFVS